MRKVSYIFLLCLILILILTACGENTSKPLPEESSKKVETAAETKAQEKKEEAKPEATEKIKLGEIWLGFDYSVKEQNVRNHLMGGFAEYYPNIVEWVDQYYADEANMNEDFLRAIELASSELTANHLQIIGEENQYGDDGFTDQDEILGLAVSEEDGYVFVSWRDRDKWLPKLYYLSVAKDGKWLYNDKIIFEENDNTSSYDWMATGTSIYLFYDGADEKKKPYLRQIRFNETGEIVFNKILFQNDSQLQGSLITTPDQKGALIYDNRSYHIFLEDNPDQPITFKDPLELIKWDRLPYRGNYYADLKHNQLYFSHRYNSDYWEGVQRMDMSTGEPLYNEEGKDKKTEKEGTYMFGSGNNKFYVMSANRDYGGENKVDLGYYDAELNVLSNEFSLPFKLEYESQFLTYTDKEIHFWTLVEFKRKLSLRLVKVLRIDRP
jgi:hypothetical protein